MAESLLGRAGDEVSPLELFFDLVFVFAVSQLSHHLVDHLSWQGAGETAVLLIPIFGIWSFTSFGVSFPQGGRAETVSIFVVMFVALFVNAFVPRAFDHDGWLFVVPFLLCHVGEVAFAWVTAAEDWLRRHYRAMSVWVLVESVLWIIGAIAEPEARLAWWAAAALVNVGGSWAGHPLPGRRFHSEEVSFDPGRMIERSRLLLLIALGETVLAIGSAVGGGPRTATSILTAGIALLATIALWMLYFRGSDPVIRASADSDSDQLRVARIAMNSQLIVLAGLIALAVAIETAVDDPTRATAAPGTVLTLHLGVLCYLGAQTWYLHALSGRWSGPRLAALAALLATIPLSLIVTPLAAIAIATTILIALTITTHRSATSAPTSPEKTAGKGTPGPSGS